MSPDGSLEDGDFAEIANAINGGGGPGSYHDLFRQMRGVRGPGDDGDRVPRTKVAYTARSALLTMPADAEAYNRVMQEALEGRALVRQDVHHFDAAGVLRVWLTWTEVREETRRVDEPKT